MTTIVIENTARTVIATGDNGATATITAGYVVSVSASTVGIQGASGSSFVSADAGNIVSIGGDGGIYASSTLSAFNTYPPLP